MEQHSYGPNGYEKGEKETRMIQLHLIRTRNDSGIGTGTGVGVGTGTGTGTGTRAGTG